MNPLWLLLIIPGIIIASVFGTLLWFQREFRKGWENR